MITPEQKKLRRAVDLIRRHNRWRRGQVDSLAMEDPHEVGCALDLICDTAELGLLKSKIKNKESNIPVITITPGREPGTLWLQHPDGEGGEFPAAAVRRAARTPAGLAAYFAKHF